MDRSNYGLNLTILLSACYCDGDRSYFKPLLQGLLKEENEHCQQDALLALDILSPNMAIQSNQLPDQTILDFLSSTRPEVRDAAVGLLELMVKENAIDVRKFIETPGALKSTLVTLQTWLDKNPEGPDSASIQKSASALLKMATEAGDDSVRLGILGSNGLSILIEYVQRSRNDTFKKLLTTMLSLICKSEKSSDQVHAALTKVISLSRLLCKHYDIDILRQIHVSLI